MEIQAAMKVIDRGNLVAIGEVTLDKVLTIYRIRVLRFTDENGKEDWKVYLPKKKTKEGWDSVLRLLDDTLKSQIENAVFESIHWELMRDVELNPQLEVKVNLYTKDELLGFANVIYEGQLELHGIQIRKGKEGKGIRLVYPYHITPDGKAQRLLQPLQGKLQSQILEKVSVEYEKAIDEQKKQQKRLESKRGKER